MGNSMMTELEEKTSFTMRELVLIAEQRGAGERRS
jgi:hypothetical protein